jgi:ABC-type multidrug transport system ATPase subunit
MSTARSNKSDSTDGAYATSTFQSHPDSVDVIIRDFSIAIVDQKDSSRRKEILHPVNTVVEGGTMFAILGGSGSGKTTMLNVIAGRYSAGQLEVDGEIRFGTLRKCTVGYVTQQDFLMPHLTVKETLQFAARMKVDPKAAIPASSPYRKESTEGPESSSSDRMYACLVNDVIQELGLRECADSLVGESSGTSNLAGGNRGLSGGERRRVSIAVQIISDAKVLCADEPTSGLDSFTAITVIEALHRLSRGPHHTTVLASVHQPRADVFHMFDAVLLLSKGGHPIYCGTTKAMVGYFRNLGHDCPANSNPADYYVDLSSVDNQSAAHLQQSRARVAALVAAYNEFQLRMCLSIATLHSEDASSPKSRSREQSGKNSRAGSDEPFMAAGHKDVLEYRAPWAQQVRLLVARFVTNNVRDASNALGGLLQALALGLVVMGIFWQLGDSEADTETRNGLMYITVSMEYYITTIILVERFCGELRVFDRELQDTLYQPSAYLTAHLLSSAPLLLLQPLLYATPIYFGCNLRHGLSHFLMFAAVNVALTWVVNGMVWMCVSVSRDFTVASLLANTNFTFISLTAGFLVNYHDIPVYVKWVRYLSFCSYGYRILMSNEFSDRQLSGCPYDDPDRCAQYNGNAILDSQDVAVNDYAGTWPCLLALFLCYHGIAYVNLHYLRHPVTGIVGSDVTLEDTGAEDSAGGMYSNPLHGGEGLGLEEGSRALLQGDEFSRAAVSIKINDVHLLVRSSGPLPPDAEAAVGSPQEQARATRGRTSKWILSGISASIQPGRLVALMGGSGSGEYLML